MKKRELDRWLAPHGLCLALGLAVAPAFSGASLAGVRNSVAPANMLQQEGRGVVKGKVVDQNGEPLIGVTVEVAGSQVKSVTDIDGNYTINAGQGKSLTFSYIGYAPHTEQIKGRASINVKMQEDSKMLQDVVVVGYGTQKKESLTGSVAVVSSKDLQNKGTLSSPVQALQGTVPGVIVTRSSGAPGDESWSMKLGSAVSTNSTDPLVIIDGVEYSDGVNGLRLLNSDDIESMNFLKDASAAIYGSKAAGGVVLITTKKAKAGKTTVQYNGSVTGKVIGCQPELMNLDQWCDNYEIAMNNDPDFKNRAQWLGYINLARQYKNKYINLDTQKHPFSGTTYFNDVADFVFMDNNWQDILWGDSWSTQHELSVSGGTDKNLFRISLGYMYDDSNLKWGDNNNQRFNLRINDDYEITKGMRLRTDIAYNRQDQVVPTMIGKVLSDGNMAQPGLPASTIDGKPYAWGGQRTPNWYAELGGDNKLKVSAINISETWSYDMTDWLSANVNLGYNTSTATRDIVTKAIDWYNYAGTRVVKSDPDQKSSKFESTFARTDYYLASGYLNFHKTFADVHNVSLMAGAQYNFTQYRYTSAWVGDINDALEVPSGSNDNDGVSGSKWHEAMMSYFGRLNYDYKSRYLLEAQARYDGSSKFQPENRWQFFWGVSGGWRISEEAFWMPLRNIVNSLKLRASYGVVGNQSGIGRYDGTQLYNFKTGSGVLLDGSKVSYIDTNGEIASYDRTWERIHNYNLGLDFGVLNNRLTGTVDFTWKKNNNMLIGVQYPGILGDGAGKSNLGKFKSNSISGILTWQDKIGQVGYHIGGTFTYATNTVVDNGTTDVISAGKKTAQQGYSMNSYFGLQYIGKIQTEEELRKYTSLYQAGNAIGWNTKLRLGDNMYADVNKDGKLDQKDVVYLGSDDPKISYSFNFGIEWKGIDASAIFQGAADRTLFRSDDNWRVPFKSSYLNQLTYTIGKTWSPENRDAYYPAYTTNSVINGYNYQMSSWSVENGAYLRLKNLTVGYTLPQAWLAKTGFIQKLRIYFVGTDIWETSKIRDGWDPEQTSDVASGIQRFPFNRTYTFGLNLTF